MACRNSDLLFCCFSLGVGDIASKYHDILRKFVINDIYDIKKMLNVSGSNMYYCKQNEGDFPSL